MGLVTQKLHIEPNAFGVVDGRSDSGTVTLPVLTWAPVPNYQQNLQGTPFSVDISVYLTSTTAGTKTFSLVSGTWPAGWSISADGVVSYDGTAIGSATVSIRATQDGVSADSNTFVVESIAVAASDTLAPTIPTGITLSSKTSSTIAVSCDAPCDPSNSATAPYSGMKEVRWYKGGVFNGVSSMSAGLSPRLSQADFTAGVSGRKYRAGHYTMLLHGQQSSGGHIPNATSVSNTGPCTTDTAGIVMRSYWSQLESTQGTYDFTRITNQLADCASLSAIQDPTGATKVLLFVMIETRTFSTTNPMPDWLAAYSSSFLIQGGPDTGVQGWRWDNTVKAGFQALCAAIGAQFDSDPCFGGIATQETSTGSVTSGGYTAAKYVQALKDESDYISNGCPTSRHMWYFNFINDAGAGQAAQTAELLDVAAHISANGALIGGPDLVFITGTGNIPTRCYPIANKYHNGTGGVPIAGPTFYSVQPAEWGGTTPGDPRSMSDLFDLARGVLADNTGAKQLKCDIVVWNWVTTAQAGNGNQKFNSDATTIFHAHPTFGTYTAGSTFTTGTLTQSGADYTIAAVGSGIGSTGDEWTAGRVSITGDATIIAKLASITGTTTTSAFAGLSFRDGDTAGSKAVHLILSSAGISSKYRSISGSTSTTVSTSTSPTTATPTWMKISRVGNLFSFYYSTTGLEWTALGSISIALSSTIYAEVFAGSGLSTSITASLQQVCVQNLASPTYTFSGLSSSTAYSITALARDLAASPNDSAASAALSVTTSPASAPSYTFRSVGTEAHGTSATCGAPSGVVAGDLLLLRADCRNNGDTFATPSGWTKISPNVNVTWSDLYARIATGTSGDDPPAMASSGSNQIIVQMACFTGDVYTTLGSIVHASIDASAAGAGASGNDIQYSALSVSLDNCLVIAWGSHNKTTTSNGATVNGLSGFTEIGQQNPNGSSMSVWWGYVQQTAATNLSAVLQTRNGTTESLRYTSEYIVLRTA